MLLLVTSKELADHYNPASTFPGAFEVSRLPPDAQVGHTAALLRLVTLIKIKIWKGGSYQLHWARRTVPFSMNNVAILSRSIYTSQDPGFFIYLGNFWMPRFLAKVLWGHLHSAVTEWRRGHSDQGRISPFKCNEHTRVALFSSRMSELHLHHHCNPWRSLWNNSTEIHVQKESKWLQKWT